VNFIVPNHLETEEQNMTGKGKKVEAVAYIRTSSAANVGDF